jgi:signal transduction histidine kinase
LADRLAVHRTLAGAPRTELAWLAAHGILRTLNTGDILSAKGQPVEGLYILLSGRMALFIDRGAGPYKLVEWLAGDVSGLLPYSRLAVAPGDSKALEPVELLAIPREQVRVMTSECFEVTSILVHTMVDRTRMFTSSDLQNEKMISLGKLSAGLAHELNNPASAIKRCAATLAGEFQNFEDSARILSGSGPSGSGPSGPGPAGSDLSDSDKSGSGPSISCLSAPQRSALDAASASAKAKPNRPERSPLEQADREEALAKWLARNGATAVDAAALADTEISLDALDHLAASFKESEAAGPALSAALRWIAADCAIRNLAQKIQDSAAQISNLVSAVKGFTHMDQANVAEPVDVGSGLANTVEVLQSKAREKSAAVTLELEPGLPNVRGYAAELNQIWSNLIDNALDALASGGQVKVLVSHENPNLIVRVVDDGPGVPANIRDRIFDPFFTTKPMGQGIGLGLDIALRLARHNGGAVDFESTAGRTEFRVTLPSA